jgi:hypothetical protein
VIRSKRKTEHDKIKADKWSSSPKISSVNFEQNTTWIDANNNERPLVMSLIHMVLTTPRLTIRHRTQLMINPKNQSAARPPLYGFLLPKRVLHPMLHPVLPRQPQCVLPREPQPTMRDLRTVINLAVIRITSRYHSIEIPPFRHTITALETTIGIIMVLATTIGIITVLVTTIVITTTILAMINVVTISTKANANANANAMNGNNNVAHAI